MRRSEISKKLNNAKRAAMERLLKSERPARPRHAWAIFPDPQHNIVGVGIGRKMTRGRWTRTPSIRIYVEHKLPLDSLPDHFLIPTAFGGVKTDVIETGRFRALLPTPPSRKRSRPAKPGCSIERSMSLSRCHGSVDETHITLCV